MIDNNLEQFKSLILENTQTVVFENTFLFLNKIVEFLSNYPDIQGVNLSSMSFILQNNEVTQNNSTHTKSIGNWNNEINIKYHLIIKDKNNNNIILNNLYKDLKIFQEIYYSNILNSTVFTNIKNTQSIIFTDPKKYLSCIEKLFGTQFLNFYTTTNEKNNLNEVIKTTNKLEHKTIKI